MIELLQIDVVVGRDASLGDLVSNSMGGAIGIGLAARWRSWIFPESRRARWSMRAGALLWLLVLAGSAWAVQPSLSRRTYWGHWASTSGPGPLFDGRVIRAAVGRATLPWNPIANSRALRDRLLHGHQPLQAVVIPGGPIDGLAPITRITDITRTEMVMLGQEGRDLVYQMRTHAGDLRLRDPAVRIENAFPDAATVAAARAQHATLDTMHIAGAYTGSGYRVWMTRAGETTSREVRLGPGLGWTLLIPFDYASGGTTRLLTALWLGALFLPIAYWGARAAADDQEWSAMLDERTRQVGAREAAALVFLAATIVLGLWLVPLLLGEPPVHWSQWLACGAGGVVGWWLGRWSLTASRPCVSCGRVPPAAAVPGGAPER
jgi:hypothetical protein